MLGLSRKRGAAALRRDHRVRRARGVPRPQAQELLVGHERAAGVLGRGRRSTPTSCWSTRCSPSATPRSSRSASTSSSSSRRAGKTIVFVTHDMGAVERFCDRAMLIERGDDPSRSASRTRSRARTTSSTSAAWCTPTSRPAATATTRACEIEDAWFETRRRADHGDRAGRAAARSCMRGALPRSRSTTRSSPSRCATRSATPCSRPRRSGAACETGQLRGRRDVASPRRPRELARAEPLQAHAVGRARRRRRRRARPARGPRRRSLVHGTRATGGIVDVPHEFAVERP